MNQSETLLLDVQKETKKAAGIFRAMNHRLRLKIMTLISHNDNLTVTEIYKKLRLEQSVTSQHLAILRRCGLLSARRESRFVYYKVNWDRVRQVESISKSLNRIHAKEHRDKLAAAL